MQTIKEAFSTKVATTVKLSDSLPDSAYWLALMSVPGIGRRTLWQLYNSLNKTQTSIDKFWVSPPSVWQKYHLSSSVLESILKNKSEYTIYSIWQSFMQTKFRVIFSWQKGFPKLLKQINDPPFAIFIKGENLDCLNQKMIGVVGSRNMTPYGRMATREIVGQLVGLGYGIVSGCMYGVDEQAHLATMASGGRTIGVLGYGFDHVYPKTLLGLQEKILSHGGLLVSEYLPDTEPKPGLFAQRNRLIAGLGLGTLVIEAQEKSGSLITAQYALDQGRGVFAVSGPFFSPYSQGTKWLINQGATLVTCGTDIFGEIEYGGQVVLELEEDDDQKPAKAEKVALYNCILETLKNGGKNYDRVAEQILQTDQLSSFTSEEINRALTELELSGSIMRSGFWYESV